MGTDGTYQEATDPENVWAWARYVTCFSCFGKGECILFGRWYFLLVLEESYYTTLAGFNSDLLPQPLKDCK